MRKVKNIQSLSLRLCFSLGLSFAVFFVHAKAEASAASPSRCEEIFISHSWPPQQWAPYLKKLIKAEQGKPGAGVKTNKAKLIPAKSVDSKIDDYRYYLVPRFLIQNYEVAKKFKNDLLTRFTGEPVYQYSYTANYLPDEWAVFKASNNLDFNINVTLFPPHSSEFAAELERVQRIVKKQQRDPELDSFFKEARFYGGGWHVNHVPTDSQNRMWPGSSGFHTEAFPIHRPLGSKSDYLMEEVDYIFYSQEKIVVQNIRKFRSPDPKKDTLAKAARYFKDPKIRQDMNEGQLEELVLAAGKEKMENLLIELHEAIFPDYVNRRGWPQKFLDTLFKDALEMDNHLEFTLVRELLPDHRPGKIIGIVGFNTSAYGKVEFFNPQVQSWERNFGMTGSSFARFNADQMPFGEPNYARKYWSQPIPTLPVENYLQEGQELPRPSVVERIVRPNSAIKDLSPRHPTVFSVGENLEVVRLWVDQNAAAHSHVFIKLLYAWIHRIYESGNTFDYIWKGQRQITYNPRTEGRRLYGPYGYKVDESLPLKQETLDKLTAFFSDPESFMEAISDIKFLSHRVTEEEARQFLYYLEEYPTPP